MERKWVCGWGWIYVTIEVVGNSRCYMFAVVLHKINCTISNTFVGINKANVPDVHLLARSGLDERVRDTTERVILRRTGHTKGIQVVPFPVSV